MSELHELTATQQVEAIASGEVSSRELTAHYLDRIKRHDGELRAFVSTFEEYALTSAGVADAAVSSNGELGILHGLPLALKDLHPSAGLPTSFGCLPLKDMVPPVDGPAIGNLRGAGAVVIGKTNVPEFGPTCYTDNNIVGETVNPYDLTVSPSGSSGGAAAAVAAGLIGIAHGSDGLGSIRTPAANCGLVGFKTSRGRTAGSGMGYVAFAVEGPLARTVADAALFLDAMGGPVSTDLWRQRVAPDAFRAAARTAPPSRLRIGRLDAPPNEVDVHPDCIAAVDLVAAELVAAGHEVTSVPAELFPPVGDLRPALKVILSAGLGQVAGMFPPEQRGLLMPYSQWLVETNTATATEYAAAQGIVAIAAARFVEVAEAFDVILSPTTTAPPVTTAHLRADDAQGCFDAMGAWSAFTPAANLAGMPAVSLPVHHTSTGVPLGIQLTARPGADDLLMSLAAELEKTFEWQHQHPPQWSS